MVRPLQRRGPDASRPSVTDALRDALKGKRSVSTPFVHPSRALSLDEESLDEEDKKTARPERLDDLVAPLILDRMLSAGHATAIGYVRSVNFNNTRMAHEARRTAQAIDALRGGDTELCLEILVRTLSGLQLADEYQDPSLLAEMEWAPPESVVPRDVLRTLIKDAKRRKNLKPKKPAAGGPPNDKTKRTGPVAGAK